MNAQTLAQRAIAFVKANKELIIERFSGDQVCRPDKSPVTILMAGAMGSGKTEFSVGLLNAIKSNAMRIDADELRKLIPEYNGLNVQETQGATSLAVDYLVNNALITGKNMIIDGTLMNYFKSELNIKRSLSRNRRVDIYYLFQDPLMSWNFTQIRARVEGRQVSKSVFIESIIKSKENIEKLFHKYGKQITINIVIKKYLHIKKETYYNFDGLNLIDKRISDPKYLNTLIP